MTLYHPRVLADKLEGLVPELQRWSHRARMALDNAQIQEKRIEDKHLQTCHSAQMQAHQFILDQECVQQAEELLQVWDKNCQEALADAQQAVNIAQSIFHEAQTTYSRMQQALQSAREALAQAEQALWQAESKEAEFAKASGSGNNEEATDGRLSAAKEAQRQAISAVRAFSAHVARYEKAVILANQALQLAGVAHQHAQAGLKASEDSVEFVRAASRALDLSKRELGQEDIVVKNTLEALQHAALMTQESSTQLGVARSHEQPAQQHTSDTLRILQIKIGLLMAMNRPDLDGRSGTMVASLQLGAVADRGDLTQTDEAKLDGLLTRLDEIDGLKPRWWSKLDLEERVEVLQNAHNALAIIYRFQPSLVEAARLPSTERGNFSEKTETIKISMKLVASNDNVQLLRTLIHESRHAYQWHLVKHFRRGFGWHTNEDWTLAQEWSDNFDDYKRPEQYGTQEYLNQPIEVDARGFSETTIKLLFGK